MSTASCCSCRPGCALDPRRFRCTVDVLADYVRVADLFAPYPDPVNVPWRRLLEDLGAQLGDGTAYLPRRHPSGEGPSAVVLGLDRLAGADGALLRRLMQAAAELGVTHVDTGEAGAGGQTRFRAGTEPALAQRFSAISRVRTGPAHDLDHAMERAFAGLGRRRCDIVLLDGLPPRSAERGAAWQRLCAYREAAEVNRVGVRVHAVEQLSGALSLPELGYVELPVPAQGVPWWADGPSADAIAEAAASRRGVVVVARGAAAGDAWSAQRMLSLPWVTSIVVTPADEGELRSATRLRTGS